MGLRERGGKWDIIFKYRGQWWTKPTGLEATERNQAAAQRIEVEMRQLLERGREGEVKPQTMGFSDAADQFIEWAKGEHRNHPNTWKRIRGSMASLKAYFGRTPIHKINVGAVQDYMAWRRQGDEERGIAPVSEVTLRHDVHALGPLFRYAKNHEWCPSNPVDDVDTPSDRDAVRIHVISRAEEMRYFETALALELENLGRAKKTTRPGTWIRAARDFRALHDVARLMLLQGPRPYIEVTRAQVGDIDLERKTWTIPESKSNAGRRTLKLLPESHWILETRIKAATERGDPWIFRGKKPGTALSDIQHSHERVLVTAGLDFVLYDFRHTAATRWAENGMGVIELAKILGHKNLATVQRYVHLSEAHVHAAMLRYGQDAADEAQKAKAEEAAKPKVIQ